MSVTQRMKIANEKASKNITNRGNVVKSVVRMTFTWDGSHSVRLTAR